MNTTFGIELLSRGGPLMIALLICSVLSLAIIIERLFALRQSRLMRVDILMEVEIAIKKKDLAAALEWVDKAKSPMTKIAKVALINSDKPKDDLKASIEEAGRIAVPQMEKFMTILQTIAVISPLLGLLGTVTGMINVFQTIVSEGTGNANILAGGISEALLTTAAGLSIAIPTLIFYNYFNKKIEHMIVEMEHLSVTLFELLTHYLSKTA
ncbi:MAG: MotA/TolQ/ExbB proton channel family protein [Deltaproteobacteria bacterium]|jgi:biopolymer transport protein ExbB|nr:MotA/TolQ/ExbB proton channel family protein [Deltaproteobacteria bacterium]MBT4087651.1 MotA/TolQ/ExbB proton channel family protein [Deltaproteobacteria bacterium]MBT4264325.1 MotA/TolQ/ExbB proton channel family protein [Deltaproteobacteria bacterium]MBT4639835.1 MotA/TolQ/ExbB proton channel family protein [Deltaproteobacteria bacterium]MBT6503294.1 MotA/TolQ/ExbB proton channel family protein [Deltaproteobacteria bacterium]